MRTKLLLLPCTALALVASSLTAQSWVLRNPATSPAARSDFGMCFDQLRGTALLFGGYNQAPGVTTAFNDTWSWNGVGWVLRPSQGQPVPAGRWGHKMVYDTRRDRAVLFGGFVPSVGLVNDTWEWNGTNWTQMAPANSPTARGFYCMAYDSWRQRTVLYGGFQGTSPNFSALGDTWTWDGSNWAQSAASGPSARGVGMMSFDAARGQMVMFGGDNGTTTFGDTWTFDGAVWQQRVTPVAPSARRDAIMDHDVLSGETILVGGANAGLVTTLADTWVWDGAVWSQYPALLSPPRWAAGMCLDSNRGEMVAFGGRDTVAGTGIFYGNTHVLPSSATRSMTMTTAPQVGLPARFQYNYPSSAVGNFSFTFFTAPFAGTTSIPIPGFASIGLIQANLFTIYSQRLAQLVDPRSLQIQLTMPNDPLLVGFPFDVQTADVSLFTNTIFWANNDLALTVQLPPAPVANFTSAPGVGPSTLAVQFTDTSVGTATNWQWDFDNNGTVDSSQQNPTWSYAAPGIYSVRFIASNAGGASSITKTNAVFVGPQTAANMVPIMPGTFSMGSSIGQPGEQPVHTVNITRPFWMGKFEVTQAEYQAVMGSNPSSFIGSNLPVNRVTWTQADSYCAALSVQEATAGRLPAGMVYRLPTEAEWEFCCRAGTTTEWSTGLTLGCDQAAFGYSGGLCPLAPGQTRPVGSFAPNAFGLHDMHGNVWEWCMDRNSPYAGSFGYATPNYPSTAVTDPFVTVGSQRIVRGSDWFLPLDPTRSAFRNVRAEDFVGTGHGFRVVLAPTLP
jgi:formylglycine-generating enzyme required for sulfatase activity